VLTNSKGMYSKALAEFLAMGTLFFTKQLRTYLERQKNHEWKQGFIENVNTKTIVIVGFGDIGAAAGRLMKNGFGAKVIGVKRRPEMTSAEHLSCADEIVGIDQLERVVSEADFVIASMPKTEETVNFFTKASCFDHMKPSAVFMNVGRGQTVKEDELVEALKSKSIAGACLDVYAVEPLAKDSPLWDMPNVLMYPHCADDDIEFMNRTFALFNKNIENFAKGQPLINVCDKHLGY
jgi:phosphoglycerate dehydrogenase-like enzyme